MREASEDQGTVRETETLGQSQGWLTCWNSQHRVLWRCSPGWARVRAGDTGLCGYDSLGAGQCACDPRVGSGAHGSELGLWFKKIPFSHIQTNVQNEDVM